MIPITTPLTKRLGEYMYYHSARERSLIVCTDITTPIICAPMAAGSTPELAAEVTAAGGFGSIGAGSDTYLNTDSFQG